MVLSKSENMRHSTRADVNLQVYLIYEVIDLPLGLNSYEQFVSLGFFHPIWNEVMKVSVSELQYRNPLLWPSRS